MSKSLLQVMVERYGQELVEIYFDGFRNVMIHGENSTPDDNPYLPEHEARGHDPYKEGSLAAEKFIKSLKKYEKRN